MYIAHAQSSSASAEQQEDDEDHTPVPPPPRMNQYLSNFLGLEDSHLPPDCIRGSWDAVSVAFSNYGLACGSFFYYPYCGWRESRYGGLLRGLPMGTVIALLLGIRGTFLGVYVALIGIFRTPRAIAGTFSGEVWDADEERWKPSNYSLQREYDSLPPIDDAAADLNTECSSSAAPRTRVKEMKFYDILEIPPNATAKMIRGAYYRLSLKYHPDKAPPGSNANQYRSKFEQVSEAYQTLSDPARRKRYDKNGRPTGDAAESPNIDAVVFFNVLFGCSKLEPLIGQLQLAQLFELGLGPDFDMEDVSLEDIGDWTTHLGMKEDYFSKKRTRREVTLALNLAKYLDAEECSDFLEHQKHEAIAACNAEPIARRFIVEISYVFINRSRRYLAEHGPWYRWPEAWNHRYDAWKRTWRRRYHTAKVAVKGTINSLSGAFYMSEGGEDGHEESNDNTVDVVMGDFVETLWGLTKMDIHTTLTSVCKKLLQDTGVSKEARLQRARRLFLLGRIILPEDILTNQAIYHSNSHEDLTILSGTARERLQEAMVSAISSSN